MTAILRALRRPFCRHGNSSRISDDGFVAWKCHDCGKVELTGSFFDPIPKARRR